MRFRRRPAFSRRARALASALVAAALIGPVAGYAHLALVQHVTCAEHGELVEIGSAAANRSIAVESSIAAIEDGSTHGHDHCAANTLKRERIAALSIESTLAAVEVRAALPIAPRASSTIALYRLAPKTSPPA